MALKNRILWRGVDLQKLPAQLADMALKGYRLRHIDIFALYFEPAQPERLEFRVLVINNSAELDEAYRLDGWRLVNYSGGFAIVCAPPGTPFTVVNNPAVMLKKLYFMRTLSLVRLVIAAIGLALVLPAMLNPGEHAFFVNLVLYLLAGVLAGFLTSEFFPLIRLQIIISRMKKGVS